MQNSQGLERRKGIMSINGLLDRKYRLIKNGKLSNRCIGIPKLPVRVKKENLNGKLSMIRMEGEKE